MTHATPPDQPTLDDHPGLDNDEATDEGKMMTAEEEATARRRRRGGRADARGSSWSR